jgi:hypothetical protein
MNNRPVQGTPVDGCDLSRKSLQVETHAAHRIGIGRQRILQCDAAARTFRLIPPAPLHSRGIAAATIYGVLRGRRASPASIHVLDQYLVLRPLVQIDAPVFAEFNQAIDTRELLKRIAISFL